MNTRKVRVLAFFTIIMFLAGLSACVSAPQGGLSDSSQSTAPPISDGAPGDSSSEPTAGGIAPAPYIPSTAGRTADGQTVAASPYERYAIPLDPYRQGVGGNAWVVDRDGNTIAEDKQFEVLYDVLSGEPQCLMLTEDETVGRTAKGALIKRELSALYDLDGNLLCDWDYYSYRAGFGDFVIRQKSANVDTEFILVVGEQYPPELWDFKQGRGVMADAWFVERLSEDRAVLSDNSYRPLAVMDGEGRVIAQNTVSDYYLTRGAWNGYMIADAGQYTGENIRDVLLSPEFAPVLSYDSLETGASEKILLYTDYADNTDNTDNTNGYNTEVARSGLVTLEGEEVFEIPSGQTCEYFDDELIVLSNGADIDSDVRYSIVRIADGEVLGEDFKLYDCDNGWKDSVVRSEFFAVYKDGTLYLLDRGGKAFAQREIPDVSGIYYILDRFMHVSTEKISGYSENSVLDMELNEIIPEGSYSYIDIARSQERNYYTYYDIFVCSRYEGAEGALLYDIVDGSGNVLISGLNDVYGYSVGSDRLAVRKGFEAGLMDWSGEWIVKRSIFSELWD